MIKLSYWTPINSMSYKGFVTPLYCPEFFQQVIQTTSRRKLRWSSPLFELPWNRLLTIGEVWCPFIFIEIVISMNMKRDLILHCNPPLISFFWLSLHNFSGNITFLYCFRIESELNISLNSFNTLTGEVVSLQFLSTPVLMVANYQFASQNNIDGYKLITYALWRLNLWTAIL